MRIFAVGDVCGNPGLDIVEAKLRPFLRQQQVDLALVNGENAAQRGITPNQARDLLDWGADVITLGNHAFAQRSICGFLDDGAPIVRPMNLAPQMPGQGYWVLDWNGLRICVVNLLGRLNMDFRASDPFECMEKFLQKPKGDLVLVDFHAEATSEKKALGYFLDGRVAAVYGTHTHVQTADDHVLPQGTGYISDLGITGSLESVIGIKYEQSISYFRGELGPRFEASDKDCALQGALFTIDENTGKCQSVERFTIR